MTKIQFIQCLYFKFEYVVLLFFFLSFDYLFFMLNKSKIRLKLSIFNKPIM